MGLWCRVDMPARPFQKLGGGRLNSWYGKQMQYTDGILVWRSHNKAIKKERVKLDGSPTAVGANVKEMVIVKASSDEKKRLKGTSDDIGLLVTAIGNKLALTECSPSITKC